MREPALHLEVSADRIRTELKGSDRARSAPKPEKRGSRMSGRLNHVAIAVPDLAAATAVYRDTLGAQVSAPQAEPEHGVNVVFVVIHKSKIWMLHPQGDAYPIQSH